MLRMSVVSSGSDGRVMSSDQSYTPPKVWKWDKPRAGEEWRYSGVNRPIAGATHDKELPVGKHPLQLYSRGTPNGVKVTVMLEELLELGRSGAEYDAWLIRIGDGDQFGSGFVEVNPNSKIPALMDRSGPEDRKSTRLNSSHSSISYAVFCLKKKTKNYSRCTPQTTTIEMWQPM